jgi:hypothetical protein
VEPWGTPDFTRKENLNYFKMVEAMGLKIIVSRLS